MMARMQPEMEIDSEPVVLTMSKLRAMMVGMRNEHRAEMDSLRSALHDMGHKYQRLEDRLTMADGRCQYLEARCESLQRSVNLLTKNQQWEYCASLTFPIVSLDMQEIRWSLKETTREIMRDGELPRRVNLGYGYEQPFDNIDPHGGDDALMPHLKELANAIQLHDSKDGECKLSIRGLQLPTTVLNMLEPALKTKKFRCFTFDNVVFPNSFCDGIKFAVELIKNNPSLKALEWRNTRFKSLDDAKCLIEAIASHPSLENIYFDNCCGYDETGNEVPPYGYDVLCLLLEKAGHHLNHISLNGNVVKTRGETHLSDFIATNPRLCELSLMDNCLNDDDAALIVAALAKNTNLRELNLHGNHFTEAGLNLLHDTIFDSTSLNSAAGSNHTCLIKYGYMEYGEWEGADDINNNSDHSHRNRARKIYTILSRRNRNGTNAVNLDSEFGDDALRLAPKVLSAVYKYSQDMLDREFDHLDDEDCQIENPRNRSVQPLSIMYEVLHLDDEDCQIENPRNRSAQPLSIMYEVLRGWQIMPELLERN